MSQSTEIHLSGFAQVGSTITHTKEGVEIDGAFIPAITLLEAACKWKAMAKEHDWQLTDTIGRPIIWPDHLKG